MCSAASSMSITRSQHEESGFPRPTPLRSEAGTLPGSPGLLERLAGRVGAAPGSIRALPALGLARWQGGELRPTTLAGCDGERPADFDADQGGPPGGREGPAQAGVARWPRSLAARRGSARPGGPGRSGPRRPAATAGAGAGRSDADVAVRVPARLGRDD